MGLSKGNAHFFCRSFDFLIPSNHFLHRRIKIIVADTFGQFRKRRYRMVKIIVYAVKAAVLDKPECRLGILIFVEKTIIPIGSLNTYFMHRIFLFLLW